MLESNFCSEGSIYTVLCSPSQKHKGNRCHPAKGSTACRPGCIWKYWGHTSPALPLPKGPENWSTAKWTMPEKAELHREKCCSWFYKKPFPKSTGVKLWQYQHWEWPFTLRVLKPEVSSRTCVSQASQEAGLFNKYCLISSILSLSTDE